MSFILNHVIEPQYDRYIVLHGAEVVLFYSKLESKIAPIKSKEPKVKSTLHGLVGNELRLSSCALLQLSRHFPPAPQDSLLPANLFTPIGTCTSLLASQIRHLLTLCAFINVIYLLTYL